MAAGDVNVNALTTITSEPTSTDSLVAVNRNTNEGQIIDYNLLADKILSKLTSKTYSGLSTTSKLLVGAINELDSDVTSLNSSKQNMIGSATKINALPYTPSVNGFIIFSIKITSNGAWYAYYSMSGSGYGGWVPSYSGNSVANYADCKMIPIKKGSTITQQGLSNCTVEAFFVPVS